MLCWSKGLRAGSDGAGAPPFACTSIPGAAFDCARLAPRRCTPSAQQQCRRMVMPSTGTTDMRAMRATLTGGSRAASWGAACRTCRKQQGACLVAQVPGVERLGAAASAIPAQGRQAIAGKPVGAACQMRAAAARACLDGLRSPLRAALVGRPRLTLAGRRGHQSAAAGHGQAGWL
jgi:hypothetical protein